MKHILAALNEKWPRYLLEILIVGLVVCGALATTNWFKNDEDKQAEKVSVNLGLPDPLAAGWKGESVCEVIEENEKIRILKCVFPPGVGHEKHYHSPHTGYTIAGGTFQITDSASSRTVEVPTGYIFKNKSVTVHEVLNVGQTTAEFLIIEPKL